MKATDWIAIYAAIVATGVLLFDVYKYYLPGYRLRMRVWHDMVPEDVPQFPDEAYLTVIIENIGVQAVTLQNMNLIFYKHWWYRWIRKKTFIKAGPVRMGQPFGEKFPYKIEPGESYRGVIRENANLIQHTFPPAH